MSYATIIPKEEKELHAFARVEDVDASYKDLAEVCARIRGKSTAWAVAFLEKAARGEIPVLYSTYAKRLGHRRELGGRKGRYPKKAAGIVLKALRSAVANGRVRGLDEEMTVRHVSANKKHTYGRLASKGRQSRANYETARVEIILRSKGKAVEKKVEVKPPEKKEAAAMPKKEPAAKKPAEKETGKSVPGKEEKKAPVNQKEDTPTKDKGEEKG